MGQTAGQLKNDVRAKRADVSRDLDALGDKLSPGRALDRRKDSAKRGLHNVREAVMGSTSEVAGGITDLPRSASQRVRGNPLAAGLIAFGAGVLVASLLPRSETEQELAQSASEGVQRAAEEVRGAGEHVVADLRDSAQTALAEVKGAASESASHVTDAASSAASQVRETTSDGH